MKMRKFRLQIKFDADDEIDIGVFNRVVDATIKSAMEIKDCVVTETRVEELINEKEIGS
jgi:hypothetical protein